MEPCRWEVKGSEKEEGESERNFFDEWRFSPIFELSAPPMASSTEPNSSNGLVRRQRAGIWHRGRSEWQGANLSTSPNQLCRSTFDVTGPRVDSGVGCGTWDLPLEVLIARPRQLLRAEDCDREALRLAPMPSEGIDQRMSQLANTDLPETMRALTKPSLEPGLALVEKPVPTPRADEVLVRVLATSICGTDLHIYNWDQWAQSNVRAPLTVGHEFCGEVVAVGEDVLELAPGDYVAAESHVFCGTCYQCRIGHRHICENEEIIGIHRDGAFAEYVAFPERCAWKTDRSIPPEIATLQEPLGNSVHATMIKDVSRKRVLVFGCGPTGLFSVAIAKICGASQVIAVDVRDFRLSLAREIGADTVIDPTKVDLVPEVRRLTDGHGADVVMEMSGNARAVEDGFRALSRGGDFRFFGVPSDRLSIDVARDIIFKGAQVQGIIGRQIYETWFDSTGLLAAGLDLAPIITHRLSLEEYETAFELIRDGNCGKIVLFPNGPVSEIAGGSTVGQ